MSSARKGFALLTITGAALAMVGTLGIAVDLGRLYITRNESQAYVDSAALDGVLELDGTLDGLNRARDVVNANTNRWGMGTTAYGDRKIEFSTTGTGGWQDNPGSGAGIRFMRVKATANVPLYFIPTLGQATALRTGATAVAGQVAMTHFREGSFPFSPVIHDMNPPNFGLIPGQQYTLRWASNPKIASNVCEGDKVQHVIDKANSTGSERGYIEETSAATIRQAIEGDYQTRPLDVGDIVNMTGGAKQTQRDSLINRVWQDTDQHSQTYAEYKAGGQGNGRRLVVVPLNTWNPDYIVMGFAAFFLLHQDEYLKGGNNPFCAEFVGAYMQGSRGNGAGQTGAYHARLIE